MGILAISVKRIVTIFHNDQFGSVCACLWFILHHYMLVFLVHSLRPECFRRTNAIKPKKEKKEKKKSIMNIALGIMPAYIFQSIMEYVRALWSTSE